jgi:outer membrane protein OmpA-like peptidoglycan-associated protein
VSRISRKSRWTFNTSASGGLSILFVSGAGGKIFLTSPSGADVAFNYASAGVGESVGFKLSPSTSQKEMPSAGQIWLLDTFSGPDLSVGDIEGYTLITEVSFVAFGGGSGAVMLIGIPSDTELKIEGLKRGVVGTILDLATGDDGLQRDSGLASLGVVGQLLALGFKDKIRDILDTGGAKAILFMGGMSAGGVAAGISQSVGYMWRAGAQPEAGNVDITLSPEEISIKSSASANDSAIFIPGDALFDFDKYNIKLSAEPILKKAGKIIRTHPRSWIVVNGHTDSTGPDDYNLKLSKQRADSVAHWLTSHGYTSGHGIQSSGYGKTRPVASNRDPFGRAKNRRVEIRIVANG